MNYKEGDMIRFVVTGEPIEFRHIGRVVKKLRTATPIYKIRTNPWVYKRVELQNIVNYATEEEIREYVVKELKSEII